MYEHQKEVNQAVNALISVVNMLMDEVDNQTQMLTITGDAVVAFTAVASAMDAETKKEYKAKILEKLGIALVNRAVDIMSPDAES